MRNKTMLVGVIGVVVGLLLAVAGSVLAGSLNPTVGPTAAGSQMYTLEQIYSRLSGGGNATKMTTFTEPSSGPTAGTMHTLDDIYALAWPARFSKTGQTKCYNAGGTEITCTNTGQDGELQKGVAWPNPRFTNNNNGTVTDNLTGLIWLKNANCFGQKVWATALTDANTLASPACGLTDGSAAGAWRLPNVRELQSLVHYGFYGPAVPNTAGTGKWTANAPFTGVQSYYYWASTTYADNLSYAWDVDLDYGNVGNGGKTNGACVWPVRGGQ